MEVVDLVVRSLVNMGVWRGWLWVLFLAFLGERINTTRVKIRDITSKEIRDIIPIKEDNLVDGILANLLNNSNSNNSMDNSMRLPEIHQLGIPTPETIPNNSNSMEHPILPSPI